MHISETGAAREESGAGIVYDILIYPTIKKLDLILILQFWQMSQMLTGKL